MLRGRLGNILVPIAMRVTCSDEGPDRLKAAWQRELVIIIELLCLSCSHSSVNILICAIKEKKNAVFCFSLLFIKLECPRGVRRVVVHLLFELLSISFPLK